MRANLATDANRSVSQESLPIEHIRTLDGLDRLRDPSLDALVWHRQIPESVAEWIEGIAAQRLPEGRYRLSPGHVETCVRDAFMAGGIDACPSLQWLCADLQGLAFRIADLLATPTLRLRLEPVSNDACSKFHIDKVVARLICTYRGPGTEVCVDPHAPETIEPVETGMPVILKGRLWDQTEPLTLKHRSPPISGSGVTRWMVVIEGAAVDDGLFQYDEPYPRQV
ncbi:MAG: DUF1826 domain-containing protein [Pseudomonadota bacterium]